MQIRSIPVWILPLVNVLGAEDHGAWHVEIDVLVMMSHVFLMLLQFVDQLRVEGIEAHLHVRQLTDWKRFQVAKQGLEFRKRSIVAVLGHARIKIAKLMHCFALLSLFIDSFLDLRILQAILLNNIDAFLRVFPMLANVLGAVGQLVVLEFVVDGVSSLVRCHEPNIFDHMYFLSKVLDV